MTKIYLAKRPADDLLKIMERLDEFYGLTKENKTDIEYWNSFESPYTGIEICTIKCQCPYKPSTLTKEEFQEKYPYPDGKLWEDVE